MIVLVIVKYVDKFRNRNGNINNIRLYVLYIVVYVIYLICKYSKFYRILSIHNVYICERKYVGVLCLNKCDVSHQW